MTLKQLLATFSWATNWNAFAYIIYKCTSTCITFFLYATLDQATFSLFCNFNSIIFLLLLWLDLGFSKSIATFVPLYQSNATAFKSFIHQLLRYKTIALLAAIPLYMFAMHAYTAPLALEHHHLFFYVGLALFLAEGINSVIRLVYHAHFLQKEYNLMYAAALMLELIVSLSMFAAANAYIVLLGIFCAKVIANVALMLVSGSRLPTIYTRGHADTPAHHGDYAAIHRRFMKHSAIMWFNNGCKSLTERNFLVPWFTYAFGPGVANLFKIANEGALLFYRIVIKTIGTTDTAVFAHIVTMDGTKSTWQIAYKKVTAKIAALCIPLLGIIWLMSHYDVIAVIKGDQYVFHIFFIICVALLTEVVCSPAERVLEVKADYARLFIAYAPYLCMLIILFATPIMTSIGLLSSIFIIHVVRLVSVMLMVILARIYYDLNDRITYALLIFSSVSISLTYMHILWGG
jgi:hypothetical protein